jgi:hypothetical protein
MGLVERRESPVPAAAYAGVIRRAAPTNNNLVTPPPAGVSTGHRARGDAPADF